MGKSISLVTGGCGFIGFHLCQKLLDLNHKVIVLDNLSTGQKTNTIDHRDIEYVFGDANEEKCIKEIFSKYDFS